jgi:Ca-activated chloride channel homolog
MDALDAEERVTIRVASPAVLWLLLMAPLFVWTAWRRARTAGLCRAAAWSLLVVVLAGPFVVHDRPAAGVCLVAAIDVSTSVQDAAVGAARRMLATLASRLGADDLVGSVAFAARPWVVATPGAPAARPPSMLLPSPDTAPDDADRNDTDIASAVATAASLCPDGKQPAVFLFTDGNETSGGVLAEVAFAERHVPVFPIVLPEGALPHVALRRLLAPPTTPARVPVPLEAVVEARAATTAAISVTVDGQAIPPRPVQLEPGISVVALPYRAREPGVQAIEARLIVPPAQPVPTGVARAALHVTRPVHVLWLSERDAPPVAAQALVRHGVDVSVVRPAAVGDTFADYDVVVLDDVGRHALADTSLRPLVRWVAAGGALVVTGGEHLFGDAGFLGSPLEPLLPVELLSQHPAPEEREPLALELVVDRSNSMGADGATKLDYAKRATLAVLEQLAPGDLVGALAFDETGVELAPLRPVAESRPALAAQLRQLRHGGGTDFLDALTIAHRRLVAEPEHVRHVILVTDGDTNRRTVDHFALIDDLVRGEVSVTTIRIGSDAANLALLNGIATATGGEFHHVERLETLPQLLIHDMQQLEASAGRRRGRPRFAAGGPMLAGVVESELPPVARWALTRARHGAEVRLVVDAGTRRDPLLVTWGYELGRVAVLPLDFQAGAAAWAVWRDFGKLWTQLVRWAAPGREETANAGGAVAREGRAVGPNRAMLEQLATATGGRVDPTPAEVIVARDGRAQETRPFGAWLVALAMALVLVDVALRRSTPG